MKLPRVFQKPDGTGGGSTVPGVVPPVALGDGAVAMHISYDIGDYVIEGYIYDTDRLIIAFENARVPRGKNDVIRFGWGAKMFRKQQRSHLCIKAKNTDWYQGDGLNEAFAALHDNGFLAQFGERITYGSSMGAFAAIAFADQLSATRVLALSPQTTLNRDLVPWENRFGGARYLSWDGPNSDAVGKSLKADKVMCVYDRHLHLERNHVDRLDQPNIQHILTPYLGHAVASELVQLGGGHHLLDYAFGDTDDLTPFYQAIRARRTTPRYYKLMRQKKRVNSSPRLSDILEKSQAIHMIAPKD